MREVVDGPALLRWCELARSALVLARDEIDGLNVFPVPDGDTGTNLLATLDAGLAAVGRAVASGTGPVAAGVPSVGVLAGELATGALVGARGNSGVVLSQLLRGLAEVLDDGPAGPGELAAGLAAGAELAAAAVAVPVEGTVISVARAAAAAAVEAAASGADLPGVVAAAHRSAQEALRRTPEQLDVLARSGVVDAGGRGWVVLLASWYEVVHGRAPDAGAGPAGASRSAPGEVPAGTAACAAGTAAPSPARQDQPHQGRSGAGASRSQEHGPTQEVEVLYLLHEAVPPALEALRARLGELGTSVVLGEGPHGLARVHVHVPDVRSAGEAVSAGLRAGRLDGLSLTPLLPVHGAPQQLSPATALLVVLEGQGLRAWAREAGADLAVATSEVGSLEALRARVASTGAARVVVLPGDDRTLSLARSESRREPGSPAVEVLATRTPAQVLAALAVHDAAADPDVDLLGMRQAAAAVRSGEVRHARGAADTSAGPCREGDAVAVVDGRVVAVGGEPLLVASALLRGLAAGAELLTVVLGQDAEDDLGDALRSYAREHLPVTEVQVLHGGQPGVLLVGAE